MRSKTHIMGVYFLDVNFSPFSQYFLKLFALSGM